MAKKEIAVKKYVVKLSAEEREQLEALIAETRADPRQSWPAGPPRHVAACQAAGVVAPIGPMRYRYFGEAGRNGQIAGAGAWDGGRQTQSRVGSNQGRKQCTV